MGIAIGIWVLCKITARWSPGSISHLPYEGMWTASPYLVIAVVACLFRRSFISLLAIGIFAVGAVAYGLSAYIRALNPEEMSFFSGGFCALFSIRGFGCSLGSGSNDYFWRIVAAA